MKNNYKWTLSSFNGKNFFKKMCAAIFTLSIGMLANAQVSAYSFAQSTGAFTPLTGGTILGTATGNTSSTNLSDVSYPVTIPFSFNFNGTVFNNFTVSSNGYISFGGTDASTDNAPLSGNENWTGAIAVWGKSINAAFDSNSNLAGDIRWDVIGTAPNREVVVQWTNFRPNRSTSTSTIYAFTFQIHLKETSNQIVTTYNSGSYVVGTSSISGSLAVGLRGSSNADFNNRSNLSSVAFASSTAGTANSSTQYASTSSSSSSGMPPAGLMYTWTPPTCFAPTLTTYSSTTNSITINWTTPTPTPATYDIYYSTSNTPPSASTTPSLTNLTGTSTTIPSLPNSTVHYFWIRSNCGTGNASEWSPAFFTYTLCQYPVVLTTTGATICQNSSATLSATAETGAIVNWYSSPTATNIVGQGATYTTPPLSATTDYYVAAANIGQDSYVGKPVPVATSTNTAVGEYGLNFDAYGAMVIKTVDVYPVHATNTTGTLTFQLKNNSDNTILAATTANVNVSSTGVLNAVPLNFVVPVPGSYRLVISAKTDITGLIREITNNINYPYTLAGICSITSARFSSTPTSSSYYYYLYNWKVATICESPRQQVTATVDAAGCLSTSEVSTKEAFKIHPNPFTDVVNIANVDKVKSISVFDVTGRLVKSNIKVSESINLSDLKSGMYLLSLELKDGSKVSHKIMKK